MDEHQPFTVCRMFYFLLNQGLYLYIFHLFGSDPHHSGNNLLGLNTYVLFNPTLVCPCPRLFDFVFPLVRAWLSQRRRPAQNKQQTAAVENIWPSLMSAWQLMILTCNPAPKSELKGKPLWSVVVQRRNDQLFVI